MPTHIIHKQKVHLRTGMSANAFQLQNRISDLFRNGLASKIENLFDQFSPDENILRIDKLELDLGIVNEKNLESEFSQQLIEQLSHSLSKQQAENTKPGLINAKIRQQRSLLDSLIYFLEHGYLPWYQPAKNISEFEAAILHSFSKTEWRYLIEALKKYIAPGNETIIQRLVMQFSETFLEKILVQLNDNLGKQWGKIYNEILLILSTTEKQTKKEMQPALWRHAIKLALEGVSENDFMTKILTSITEENKESKPAKNHDKDDDKTKPAKHKANRTDGLKEEEFFTDNCGIVLLHPFLQMYFEELGLLDEKNFKDAGARHRAVLLLHYLATGETEVAEFNLMFPKLLCNIDFDEPVPNHIELTEKETEESSNLLRSVTQHWKPLQRTSAEGLRATFLQRKGKLVEAETGWILKVEQKTIDILLEKLPWGIGTIMLPWMKKVLNVEWF